MKQILFSPPDMTQEEAKAASEAILSGWITTGPRTKKLERVISDFVDAKNCICLNSQTACSEMVLRLLGVGSGDEVIVPAYTYTASCSVICHVGATPILVDVQKDSLEMDYNKIAELINKKTKVIIPVDLAGVPCDYDRIFEIINSKKHLFVPKNDIQRSFGRVIVLADTAHALGAQYKGKMVGSIADFSSFSFHAVKNMTTAEGGALTWNDFPGIDSAELYHQFQLLSLHGQSKDALSKTKLGSWEYDIVGPWYKCNMTDVLASIGLVQMQRYNSLLERRKNIVAKYNESLKEFDVKLLDHLNETRQSSCHLYIVRLNDFSVEQRNKFIELMAEQGVACNVHYKPLPMFTAYKELGFDIKDYPNAYDFYHNEVTLPLHTSLTDEDVERVMTAFKNAYMTIKENK